MFLHCRPTHPRRGRPAMYCSRDRPTGRTRNQRVDPGDPGNGLPTDLVIDPGTGMSTAVYSCKT